MSWKKLLKYKTDVVILSLLIIGVGFVFLFIPSKLTDDASFLGTQETASTITIGDSLFTVEIVDTPQAREQGLSGREVLPENHGMLFVFDEPTIHTFWMKEMLFPLDFIWINGDTVVDITQNVQLFDANGDITTIQSTVAADKVLEVNAGIINESGIKLDQEITIDSSQ